MRYLSLLLVFISLTASAQKIPTNPNQRLDGKRDGKWTIMVDADWKEVSDPKLAAYYRLIEFVKGKPTGVCRDYFLSGKVQWEGMLSGTDPDLNEGLCVWYDEQGNKTRESNFKNGILEGKSVYYSGGRKYSEGTYTNGNRNLDWVWYGTDFDSYYLTGEQAQNLADFPKTETSFRKAAQAAKATFGEFSIQNMNSHWNLAFTYQSLGDVPSMVSEWRETMRLSRGIKNDDELNAVLFTEGIAVDLANNKYNTEALELYKYASKRREMANLKVGLPYYTDLKYVLDLSYNLGIKDSLHFQFRKIAAILPVDAEVFPRHLHDWASYSIGRKGYDNFDDVEKYCVAYLAEKDKKKVRDIPAAEVMITYGRLLTLRGQYERAMRSFVDARAILEPIKDQHKSLYLNLFSKVTELGELAKNFDAKWAAEYERLYELWKVDITADQYNQGLMDNMKSSYWTGDLKKTEALIRKSMVITEKESGIESNDYVMLKVFLAGVLEKQGKMGESQAITKTLTKKNEEQLIDEFGLKNGLREADELGKYISTGYYAKAIMLFEKSSEMMTSTFAKQGKYDAIIEQYCGIALCYRETGNLSKAVDNLALARKVVGERFKREDMMNVFMLRNEGEFFQFTGDLRRAELKFIEGMKILDETQTKENADTNDQEYYQLAWGLASIYKLLYHYDDAEKYFQSVANYRWKKYGPESVMFANALIALADCNRHFGEYGLAQQKLDIAIPIVKKEGENNLAYVHAQYDQASLYLERTQYKESEAIFLKLRAYYAQALGRRSDRYLSATNQLGSLYTYSKQFEKGAPIFAELNQINLFRITNFFHTLSEEEKALFFKESYAGINSYNSFVRRYYPVKPAEAGSMYDIQLNTKGLLFRATSRVKETIVSAKDDSLKSMFRRWQRGKDFLAKVYQMSDEEKKSAGVSEKQLEDGLNALEKQMTQRSELFAELLHSAPTWKSVQQKLVAGEAAVEIVKVYEASPELQFGFIGKGLNYDSAGTDGATVIEVLSERTPAYKAGIREGDVILKINGQALKEKNRKVISDLLAASPATLNMLRKTAQQPYTVKMVSDSVFVHSTPRKIKYVALILTPDTKEHPLLVSLENGNDLENRYGRFYQNAIKQRLQDEYSYKQFWQPIQDKLKGIKKVYFSPDGVYNFLNPSTFYNPTTKKYLLDELEVIIVGNTADLLETHAATKSKKAVLIGFPDYNKTGSAAMARPAYASDVDYSILKKDSASTRFMSGSTVNELPGTKVEVATIEALLRGAQIDVSRLIAQDASEEKIKAIQSPWILHIATHGFFMSEIPPRDDGEGRSLTGVSARKLSENPLLRSGLLFAGAGTTISQGKQSASSEDGILTAFEAMNLNLSGTELVVMSACETGLGEIKSGEGVYGLQRAFRAAGAESVLMSLWKVDDQATQQLMTEFYKEWLKSGDKRNALRSAQLSLRQRFEHPYYWGAFEVVGH